MTEQANIIKVSNKVVAKMSDVGKGMILVLMILYIVSPIDACPGPIDDLIVLFIGLAARKGMNLIED